MGTLNNGQDGRESEICVQLVNIWILKFPLPLGSISTGLKEGYLVWAFTRMCRIFEVHPLVSGGKRNPLNFKQVLSKLLPRD